MLASNEGKHSRHIRLNHARTFGHTQDNNLTGAERNAFTDQFGNRIGGHNGAGGIANHRNGATLPPH